MPTYRSKDGIWTPAKEKVAITNSKGEPEVYEGPDRAATEEIKAGNITSQHFSKDPEFIARVRQVHNCSMAEYMAMNGYDEKTSNEEFEKKMKEVVLHKDLPRGNAKKFPSGGRNTAGASGHYEGDFGDLADARGKVK